MFGLLSMIDQTFMDEALKMMGGLM